MVELIHGSTQECGGQCAQRLPVEARREGAGNGVAGQGGRLAGSSVALHVLHVGRMEEPTRRGGVVEASSMSCPSQTA